MPPQQPTTMLPPQQSNNNIGVIGATLLVGALALWGASYLGYVSLNATPAKNSPEAQKTAQIGLGTYALVGRGAGQSGNYAGTVKISSRESTSNVFDLQWNITSGQAQIGVGILSGDVLSVGYYEDDPDGNIKDIGVVSYHVIDSQHLEGQWSSVQGGTAGLEQLTLQPNI